MRACCLPFWRQHTRHLAHPLPPPPHLPTPPQQTQLELPPDLRGFHPDSDVLPHPKLVGGEGEGEGSGGGAGSGAPAAATPVDLHSLEQALLLGRCLHVRKGSAADGLQPWEMAAYVDASECQPGLSSCGLRGGGRGQGHWLRLPVGLRLDAAASAPADHAPTRRLRQPTDPAPQSRASSARSSCCTRRRRCRRAAWRSSAAARGTAPCCRWSRWCRPWPAPSPRCRRRCACGERRAPLQGRSWGGAWRALRPGPLDQLLPTAELHTRSSPSSTLPHTALPCPQLRLCRLVPAGGAAAARAGRAAGGHGAGGRGAGAVRGPGAVGQPDRVLPAAGQARAGGRIGAGGGAALPGQHAPARRSRPACAMPSTPTRQPCNHAATTQPLYHQPPAPHDRPRS